MEEENQNKKEIKSFFAHDNRTKISVEGLGEIEISRCSMGDVIDAFETEPKDPRMFTVGLLSKTIHEPKYSPEALAELPDATIEEIGRKWLDFNSYYLEDFKRIDQDDNSKDLVFYKKFVMAIEAPEKRALESLKPIADKLRKRNEEMIRAISSNFRIPSFEKLFPVSKSIQETLSLGKRLNEQIEQQNLGKALSKAMLPNIAKGFDKTFGSTRALIDLSKTLNEQGPFRDLPSIEALPNPQWETVKAVNKVKEAVTESIEAAQNLEERFIRVLEEQNLAAQENIDVQVQVRNLTRWLVVLTILLVILTIYLIWFTLNNKL